MKQFNLSSKLLSLILIVTAILLAVVFFIFTLEIRDKAEQQCLASGLYNMENCPHKDYVPFLSYIGFSISLFLGILGVFLWFSVKKCSECIDVNKLKTAFEGIGLIFGSTKYFDLSSSEGSELVKKFNITKVPTVILAGDTSAYPGLENFWLQFGTIEDNNIYVFRSLELIQDVVYFDLNQNKIVGISDTNN